MQPTKSWSLVVVAIISAAIAWVVALTSFASLPPLPWTAVPALALLAFGELLFARNLRSRMPWTVRPGVRPVDPLAAGFCIYTLASLAKPVPRHDALVSAFTVAASIALLAAALYLERCCRSPKPPDDVDDDTTYPNGQHGRR